MDEELEELDSTFSCFFPCGFGRSVRREKEMWLSVILRWSWKVQSLKRFGRWSST